MAFATPRGQPEAYATQARVQNTGKKRPDRPGQGENRTDRFRFKETKMLRERMVKVARALNGHWKDGMPETVGVCAEYAGGCTAIKQDLPIGSCCAGQDGVLWS